MSPANRLDDDRLAAADTALAILAGRLGVIEGSRRLASLSARLPGEDQAFLRPFCGIDSETDALPVGGVRAEWADEALAQKDAEVAGAESVYRAHAEEACRALLRYLELAGEQEIRADGQRHG